MANKILKRRQRIKKRVRSRIIRQSDRPRLSVHKTNNHIYAQVIDDFKEKTLVSASDFDLKSTDKKTHIEKAQLVGKELAAKMKRKKIKEAVLDRGAYPYKGRIKALTEAVRENGITI